MTNQTDHQTVGLAVPLKAEHVEMLRLIVDLIVPPSEDGHLPGASEYDVAGYINQRDPGLILELRSDFEKLEKRADASHGKCFAALTPYEREDLTNRLRAEDAGFLAVLALHTVACYYIQDQVLEAIGMPARPPAPLGYEVKAGDLSLLNPVRARGKVYRDAPA